jgi:hypothetical protein
MEDMFLRAKKFNQDLTGWQVGQVTLCKEFCRRSKLSKNNQPSLPKNCLKRCS